ncbi:arrestin domain-containing protein 17-like [Haliotis rufescens]|uniref:arrestin domain-containing protein 17-like n=1 Tax=Haliotis rufescens TaxID=6454 RepID=UPI00201F03EA|nr:arrestin domain-containing protein 17-like [Haliotis rufescens]
MMGKLQTFDICVTNSSGVCHPGGILKGRVALEASQILDTKDIRIECRGQARVFWEDSSSSMSEPQNPGYADQHTAEEEYLSVSKKLWSGQLPRGSHNLQFQFHIPEGVPSSFDGEFGYIRYWLKVFIDRSWRTDTNTKLFTVLAKVDLNEIPDANEFVEVADSMKVSALFSPSGVCNAALRLNRKGFVPGEIIPLKFSIRNDTARDVHRVSVELRQITDYKARSQDKRTERVMAKLKFGRIPARATYEKRENKLRLPLCPPGNLRGCGLIHSYQKVMLKVKPSALSFKQMKIPIELIVGTVPLRQGSLSSGLDSGVVGLQHIPPELPGTSDPDWTTPSPPTYEMTLYRSQSPGHLPSSPGAVDTRSSSINHHQDDYLTIPPAYTPPRPRANTNSSILRARGR